jgi:mannose-6-phosphate isomerase-like protein (cupin superfamily)
MTVTELGVAPGSGPATHIHLREDELWWVLEGDFRFRTADDWLRASPGGRAFGPRGMPHAFQNIGGAPPVGC